MVYITRDVKDVVVSGYYFTKACEFSPKSTSKDQLIGRLLDDKVLYGPYWEHVLEFWQIRNEPNIFFISYEELKTNLKDCLRRLCIFMEKPFEDTDLEKMCHHLTFQNMLGLYISK